MKICKVTCFRVIILLVLPLLLLISVKGDVSGACIGVGYGHLDCCWKWTTARGVEYMEITTQRQVANMNSDSGFKFSQDGAVMHEWMEDFNQGYFNDIKAKVANGQWEAMADWSDPLQDFIDGEGMVRSVVNAMWYYEEKFNGYRSQVRGHPDNFSAFTAGNYPQVLKKCGLTMQWFCRWPDWTTAGAPFWWVANDGTEMACYRTPRWFNCPFGTCACGTSTSNWDTASTYGQGDAGNGPYNNEIDVGDCNGTGCDSRGSFMDLYNSVNWGNVSNYKGDTGGNGGGRTLTNEAYGVYCYRPYLKTKHRRGINDLMTAEKYCTFARKYDGTYVYPETSLTEDGWRPILYWQHHDSLGGNFNWPANGYSEEESITESATTMQGGWDTALSELDTALTTIEAKMDTSGTGVAVAVYNPSSWLRSEAVEVLYSDLGYSEGADVIVKNSDGVEVIVQKVNDTVLDSGQKVVFLAQDIPAMGFEVFKITLGVSSATSSDEINVVGNFMENDQVSVTVQSSGNGWWNSVIDKSDGNRETVNAEANKLGSASNVPARTADGDYGWDFTPNFTELGNASLNTVVESGPVRGKIRVMHTYDGGDIYQDTILMPFQHRVTGHMHSSNCSTNRIHLGMRFDLTTTASNHTCEAVYGYCVTDNAAPHEPMINWVDLSDGTRGVSVITDSKYGFDTADNYIYVDLISLPDFADQHCYYAYFPHTGSWKTETPKIGYEINTPFITRVVASHAGSGGTGKKKQFITVDDNNLIVSVVKQHRSSDDMIVRFYEFSGQSGTANITMNDVGVITDAREIEMNEWVDTAGNALTLVDGNRGFQISYSPYEIITVKLDTMDFGTPVKAVMSADPPNMYADNTSTVLITAELVDDNDLLVLNATNEVQFFTDMGTFMTPATRDAVDGIATVILKSGTSQGTALVEAWPTGLTQDSVQVEIREIQVADSITMNVANSPLFSNGISSTTVTAEIRDQFNDIFTAATNEIAFGLNVLSGPGGTLIGSTSKAAVNGITTIIVQSPENGSGQDSITGSATGITAGAGDVFYEHTNWFYRVPVTVTNNNLGEVYNYKVKVTLTPGTFPNYARVNADGSDIRFGDDSGTWLDDSNLYDYRIVTWAYNGTSEIWVDIDTIPAGVSTMYMYYGNTGASSASDDGMNVWLDTTEDFSSAPTGILTGTAVITNGYCRLTEALSNQSGSYEYLMNPGAGFTAEFDYWSGGGNGADSVWLYAYNNATPTSEDSGGYQFAWDEYAGEVQFNYSGTSIASWANANLDDSAWHTVRVEMSGDSVQMFHEGTQRINSSYSGDKSGSKFGFGGRTGGSNNEHRIDNITITKDFTLEPVCTFGAEEDKLPPSGPTKIVNTASPTALLGDGITTSLITARIFDDWNQLQDVSNEITFSVLGSGSLLGATLKDASAGVATVVFQSAPANEIVGIRSVSAGLVDGTVGVALTSPTRLVTTASNTSILANGSSTSLITTDVCNDLYIIESAATNEITFTVTSKATLIGTTRKSAVAGRATIIMQSGTGVGTATVSSVSSGLVSDSADVELLVGPGSKLVNIASETNILANGTDTSLITAQVTDDYNNPVTTLAGGGGGGGGWSGFANNGGGSWQYRKPLTITSSSALSDYQVDIAFTAAGVAGLISGGKMQSNCEDVRFTLSDESTEVSYWLDSTFSDANFFWVNVPAVANGSTVIYMYYGNASATAVSDGDATFEIFDDFEGTSLDTGKWQTWQVGPGTKNMSVSGGSLNLSAQGSEWTCSGIYTQSTSNYSSLIIEVKNKWDMSATNDTNKEVRITDAIPALQDSGDQYRFDYYHSATQDKYRLVKNISDVGSEQVSVALVNENPTNYEWERYVMYSGNQEGYRSTDGINYSSLWSTNENTILTLPDDLYIGYSVSEGYNVGAATTQLDWLRVRQYASNEPTEAVGAEEENTAPATAIVFSVSGTGTLLGSTAPTTTAGSATVIMQSSGSTGNAVVTSTADALDIGTVEIVCGSSGPERLVATATPASVKADGSSTSLVTALIYDGGTTLQTDANNQITFSISGTGDLTGTTKANASGGILTVVMESVLDSVGTATITAAASGLTSGSVEVDTLPRQEKILCTADKTTIMANGTSTALVTARVCDGQDALVNTADDTITFSVSGVGTLIGGTLKSASSGIATVILQSGMSEGTATVGATAAGLSSGDVAVELSNDLFVNAYGAPTSIIANNTSTTMLTAEIVDAGMNIETDATNNVKFTILDAGYGTLLNYNPVDGIDAVNGIATVAYQSNLGIPSNGIVRVRVQPAGILAGTVNLGITAGTVSRLSCVPAYSIIVADGTSDLTITAKLEDAWGHQIEAATNSISFDISGQGSISGTDEVVASSGTAVISIKPTTTPGAITVTATASGLTEGATTFASIQGVVNLSLAGGVTYFYFDDLQTFNVDIEDTGGQRIVSARTPVTLSAYRDYLTLSEPDTTKTIDASSEGAYSCQIENIVFSETGIYTVEVGGPGLQTETMKVKSYINPVQKSDIGSSTDNSDIKVSFPINSLEAGAVLEVKVFSKNEVTDSELLAKIEAANAKAENYPGVTDRFQVEGEMLVREGILRPIDDYLETIRDFKLHDGYGNEITESKDGGEKFTVEIDFFIYRRDTSDDGTGWRTINGEILPKWEMRVCRLNEETSEWEPVEQIDYNINRNGLSPFIVAEVEHFSTYCLMGVEPAGDTLSLWAVDSYPNPSQGDVNFIFDLNMAAKVDISIYTINGRLIDKLEDEEGYHQGIGNDIYWDGSGLANGVYFFKVEATDGITTRSAVNKFVIVR